MNHESFVNFFIAFKLKFFLLNIKTFKKTGKSYSIMGRSPNLGLVPQICESLFTQIAERQKSNPKDEFEVKK